MKKIAILSIAFLGLVPFVNAESISSRSIEKNCVAEFAINDVYGPYISGNFLCTDGDGSIRLFNDGSVLITIEDGSAFRGTYSYDGNIQKGSQLRITFNLVGAGTHHGYLCWGLKEDRLSILFDGLQFRMQ